jgi:hypothetical protein
MLVDPQALAVTGAIGTPFSLPRVGSGVDLGTYQTNDGNVTMSIRHNYAKRNRHSVIFSLTKIAPDPLISAQNIVYTAKVQVVLDVPKTGFTVAELVNLAVGSFGNLTATTNKNLTGLAGGES